MPLPMPGREIKEESPGVGVCGEEVQGCTGWSKLPPSHPHWLPLSMALLGLSCVARTGLDMVWAQRSCECRGDRICLVYGGGLKAQQRGLCAAGVQ